MVEVNLINFRSQQRPCFVAMDSESPEDELIELLTCHRSDPFSGSKCMFEDSKNHVL